MILLLFLLLLIILMKPKKIHKILNSFTAKFKVIKMTEKQKNAQRIKYLKEGIALLEKGIDPAEFWEWMSWDYKNKIYLSDFGMEILYLNGSTCSKKLITTHGFKFSKISDLKAMLHNWKRFLQLVEKL